MVTDKQTGKMRLQFWRDTVDAIYQVIVQNVFDYKMFYFMLLQNERVPEHPVAIALAHVSLLCNLDV